jgi:hypothetical protein
VNDVPEEGRDTTREGRATDLHGRNLTLGGGGSVCVPSSAERKYLTENAIRLISNVSGRETLESEQPPGGRASGEAGGRTRPPDRPRKRGGRVARPCEGGPDGDDRPDPAGRSRGGRGAVAGRPRCRKHVAEYDSPPGRWDVYHDLDAGEGQHHE